METDPWTAGALWAAGYVKVHGRPPDTREIAGHSGRRAPGGLPSPGIPLGYTFPAPGEVLYKAAPALGLSDSAPFIQDDRPLTVRDIVYGLDRSLTILGKSADGEHITIRFPFAGDGTVRMETGEVCPVVSGLCPICARPELTAGEKEVRKIVDRLADILRSEPAPPKPEPALPCGCAPCTRAWVAAQITCVNAPDSIRHTENCGYKHLTIPPGGPCVCQMGPTVWSEPQKAGNRCPSCDHAAPRAFTDADSSFWVCENEACAVRRFGLAQYD